VRRVGEGEGERDGEGDRERKREEEEEEEVEEEEEEEEEEKEEEEKTFQKLTCWSFSTINSDGNFSKNSAHFFKTPSHVSFKKIFPWCKKRESFACRSRISQKRIPAKNWLGREKAWVLVWGLSGRREGRRRERRRREGRRRVGRRRVVRGKVRRGKGEEKGGEEKG
jgi:hypothetical protein